MSTQENIDYKQLLTNLIHKQITILGPTLPLLLVRQIKGITVLDNGTVTQVSNDPKSVVSQFINQFTRVSQTLTSHTIKPSISGIFGEKYYLELLQESRNLQGNVQPENHT